MNELLLAETVQALVAATNDARIRATNLDHAGTPESVEATRRHLANLFKPILTNLFGPPVPPRPKIVCLCGSTRFFDTFVSAARNEALQGNIVLTLASTQSSQQLGPRRKKAFDELHLRKIDMADEVFVINVGHYLGESTRREIDYAVSIGTPVRFLKPPPSTPDPAAPE